MERSLVLIKPDAMKRHLAGAIIARFQEKGLKLVGLKMNTPEEKLEDVVKLLPSLNAPTVAGLYHTKWYSVETVVDSAIVRELIPRLIKAGAEGIIEYPLNKVI